MFETSVHLFVDNLSAEFCKLILPRLRGVKRLTQPRENLSWQSLLNYLPYVFLAILMRNKIHRAM